MTPLKIENLNHYNLSEGEALMNKNAKDMFDKLYEYCTDNGYQIIAVYFQDDEALLLDNFSRTHFVAIYEDGYWE